MKIKLLILVNLSFLSLTAASVDDGVLSLQVTSYLQSCHSAGRAVEIEAIQKFFDNGFDAKHVFGNGDTLIHIAARINDKEFCRFLIDEKKLDVNAKNSLGDTPLYLAVNNIKFKKLGTQQVSIETTEFLVSRKADIFTKNNNEMTPISLATRLNEHYPSFGFQPVLDLLQKRVEEIDQSKKEALKAELELIEYLPKEVAKIVGDYVRE